MARRLLLDTGFIVALVNAEDPDHARCVSVWKELRARLFSVEGVLVECAHLLRRASGAPATATRLVFAAGTEIQPLTEERALRATTLMAKYRDIPMDFVDALLVTVAEDRQVSEILTLDHRGFESYRISGRKRFVLLP